MRNKIFWEILNLIKPKRNNLKNSLFHLLIFRIPVSCKKKNSILVDHLSLVIVAVPIGVRLTVQEKRSKIELGQDTRSWKSLSVGWGKTPLGRITESQDQFSLHFFNFSSNRESVIVSGREKTWTCFIQVREKMSSLEVIGLYSSNSRVPRSRRVTIYIVGPDL